MELNNYYNFKNPVRHFININSVIFPSNILSYTINDLARTEPFNFRVKKQDDKYRILKMPNILNFACAYLQYCSLQNFMNVNEIDPIHKRLVANVDTGDFISGEFDRQLEIDFEKLCLYDNLLKLDIKNYYGRIYTHRLEFNGLSERFLTSLNLGATNGLIMGNYLSLYFAETYLKNISDDIENQITKENIGCEFTYFSDDFYFFCNKKNNEKVVKIFDNVLEKYDLERNENKKEIWTYEDYNDYHVVEKYWKKLMAECNIRFNKDKDDNNMYFINQLIYRMSNLSDVKLKKVFINNFFKTNYFQTLDLNKYKVRDYNYHQLSFIFKFSPESMLYAINSYKLMADFENSKIEKFLKLRFKESFYESFNDEQLYFYYAIKLLQLDHLLKEMKDLVLKSNNQILISYYLKDGIFEVDDLNILESNIEERCWFQNYHLILYSDLSKDLENNIKKYLIPTKAVSKKRNNTQTYFDFYKTNIEAGIPLINDIEKVNCEVQSYLEMKINESKEKNTDN